MSQIGMCGVSHLLLEHLITSVVSQAQLVSPIVALPAQLVVNFIFPYYSYHNLTLYYSYYNVMLSILPYNIVHFIILYCQYYNNIFSSNKSHKWSLYIIGAHYKAIIIIMRHCMCGVRQTVTQYHKFSEGLIMNNVIQVTSMQSW